MAKPSPVPLAFVVLRTRGERAPALLLAHPLAGVPELHRHVRRLRAAARQPHRARRDGQRAAPGHRFRRVENQVEEGLLQLGRRAHHRRQVRLELLRPLNVLVLQLVPDQQTQLLDQLVQVHRRQLRLGRAGKIQDLLHDPVQLLDLLVDDARVLRARVALGELQIQRVVEHLQHRQRIANLMRHLGRQQARARKASRSGATALPHPRPARRAAPSRWRWPTAPPGPRGCESPRSRSCRAGRCRR